jgi:hypothetical protein
MGQNRAYRAQLTQLPKGNRGPIGPLDPSEPFRDLLGNALRPDDVLSRDELVHILQLRGIPIQRSDLDDLARTGAGPLFVEGQGDLNYRVGDVLNWFKTEPELPTINRRQATEYIRSLGYEIKDDELHELAKHQRGPRYERFGREVRYRPEDLDQWVADRKAGKTPKFFHARQRRLGASQRVDEMEKVTLNLRAGDFQKLKVLCGPHGASKVIRELVSYYLDLTVEARGEVDARIAEKRVSKIKDTAKAFGLSVSMVSKHLRIPKEAREAPTMSIALSTVARANARRRGE